MSVFFTSTYSCFIWPSIKWRDYLFAHKTILHLTKLDDRVKNIFPLLLDEYFFTFYKKTRKMIQVKMWDSVLYKKQMV